MNSIKDILKNNQNTFKKSEEMVKKYFSSYLLELSQINELILLQQKKNNILDKLNNIIEKFLNEVSDEDIKNFLLNGELEKYLKSYLYNILKDQLLKEYKDLQKKITENSSNNKVHINNSLNIPVSNSIIGELHPITITSKRIFDIMKKMQFNWVNAPEVDLIENIFDKLNMDKFHPAREEQQSFLLTEPFSNYSPRTHCTSMQAHIISTWDETTPLRCFHIGKTYRRDSDATHTPMFHQFDLLYIDDDNGNIPTLIGFIDIFLSEFFGKNIETRIRTSYFPFTTPSYEVDCFLNGRWLEIGGCGIVHHNVFKAHQKRFANSWAWGMGLERLTMVMGDYTDIRAFYKNDISSY